MTAQDEIRQAMEDAINAFNQGDPSGLLDLFDDDIEAFDHAPYRFDDKTTFVAYLHTLLVGAEKALLTFHQPSYRAFNEVAGTVTTYDTFTVFPAGGAAPITQNNRTTYV